MGEDGGMEGIPPELMLGMSKGGYDFQQPTAKMLVISCKKNKARSYTDLFTRSTSFATSAAQKLLDMSSHGSLAVAFVWFSSVSSSVFPSLAAEVDAKTLSRPESPNDRPRLVHTAPIMTRSHHDSDRDQRASGSGSGSDLAEREVTVARRSGVDELGFITATTTAHRHGDAGAVR